MTKHLLLIWCVFACISMLIYAFTGVPMWSALQPKVDAERAILLMMFHIAGPIAYLASRIP